jgi:hypothetical protein
MDDLLTGDRRLGGSGGRSCEVFLKTPSGYRFIGSMVGGIRTLGWASDDRSNSENLWKAEPSQQRLHSIF